jgi:hypothetical protein
MRKTAAASCDVTRGGAHIAVIHERFEAPDHEFELASDTRPVGLFALVALRPARFPSRGRFTECGLQRERYEQAITRLDLSL